MLSIIVPKAKCLNLSDIKEFTLLENNSSYIHICKINNELKDTKNKMEPYMRKYEKKDGRNIFKTVISNFESFKFTRNLISSSRNTPCVSIAWIKAYELISTFNKFTENPYYVKIFWRSC